MGVRVLMGPGEILGPNEEAVYGCRGCVFGSTVCTWWRVWRLLCCTLEIPVDNIVI